MPPKGLLSAALSGAPGAAAPPAPPAAPTLFRPVVDNYAFPCLAHAPDDGTPVPSMSEVVDGLEGLNLGSFKDLVVGSAPTARASLPDGTPLVRPRRGAGKSDLGSQAVSVAHGPSDPPSTPRRWTSRWTRTTGAVARRSRPSR